MERRSVSLTVEIRVIRFVFFEDDINGSEEHLGNGDDSFLAAPAFLQKEIAAAHFEEFA